MAEANKKDNIALKKVLYISYSLYFQKDIVEVRALIDSGSKINIMTLAFISKLGLKVGHTNIKPQIIDNSTL